MNTRRLKPGEIGERAACQWFLNNGWSMVRTQPAIEILGVAPGRRFGNIFTVRMVGRGGVPDFTGYIKNGVPHMHSDLSTFTWRPLYVACEVKEATGDTMPCSRLDKEQREFMRALPEGCAWVGIFWMDTGKFTMHRYKDSGSYKASEECAESLVGA